MTLSNCINSSVSGYQALTNTGVFNARSIVNTANQTSITNQNGTSGNSVVSLTSTIYTNISFNSGTNTLSNYSTGTFTPTLINSGTPPTVTYNYQLGYFTRIGNWQFFYLAISIATYTAGTGNALFTGMSPGPNTGVGCSSNYVLTNVTFPSVPTNKICQATVISNQLTVGFVNSAVGNNGLPAANVAAGSIFNITFRYRVT